jgi:hypothetical protein
LEGPWTYAGNDLPQDFSKIPPGSEVSEVLASVPGTDESKDAVLLAQVPTVAVVKRSEAESKAKVEYTGDPEFAPIPGTDLSYATNAGHYQSSDSAARCFSLELDLARSLGCLPGPRFGSLIHRAIYEMAAPTGRTAFGSSDSEGIASPLAVDRAAPIHFPKITAISNFCRYCCPIGCRSRASLGLFKAYC